MSTEHPPTLVSQTDLAEMCGGPLPQELFKRLRELGIHPVVVGVREQAGFFDPQDAKRAAKSFLGRDYEGNIQMKGQGDE